MRYRHYIALAVILAIAGFVSCKKYKDTPGATDPRLQTRKYCNDPLAVNYNWDFPGVPDNSTCFYPAALFSGKYSFHDSIYTPDGKLARVDNLMLTLTQLTTKNLSVSGLCPSGSMSFTATKYYTASVDTTVADSLSAIYGQIMCRQQDTVNGTFTKSYTNDTLLTVDLTVLADTGTTYHRGTAYKQ